MSRLAAAGCTTSLGVGAVLRAPTMVRSSLLVAWMGVSTLGFRASHWGLLRRLPSASRNTRSVWGQQAGDHATHEQQGHNTRDDDRLLDMTREDTARQKWHQPQIMLLKCCGQQLASLF